MRVKPPPPLPYCPPPASSLSIIHADDHLIIVNKPTGLLSVPGRGPGLQICALSMVQETYLDALNVHRLDLDTSGLLVFARGSAAQKALSVAFATGAVNKAYQAIVHGRPEAASGEIHLPIGRDWAARPLRRIDREAGQSAHTEWERLETYEATSRLRLTPRTGRTHQLRVHMAAMGHPILGDRLYGPGKVNDSGARLHLHAECLDLPHPVDSERLNLHSPPSF